MAEFVLHCFPQSGNAYKVGLCLSLLDADWEPVAVDYFGGETRTKEWREAVNEMGEVPVLEHRGQKLAQSGIILNYLADLFDRFRGGSPEETREIWRWILFDNHKFTSYFATHRWLRNFADPRGHPEVLSFLKSRADAALGIVEKHLSDHDFLVGDRLTIADISLLGYLYFPVEETGYDLPASHPRIHAWTRRVAALPGSRPPYVLFAGSDPAGAARAR
jgi:glutathione S-transferase